MEGGLSIYGHTQSFKRKGKNTRLEGFYNKLYHALNKVLVFINNVI